MAIAAASRADARLRGQVALDANFIADLGLDSLDAVELVIAFEDEFDLDIPDDDADKIFSAKDAVEYIMSH